MKIIQKIIIWGNIFLLIVLGADIFIASIILKPITIFLCQFSPGVLENFAVTTIIFFIATAWKVSKYGVFSGPYFSAFGLNTERYSGPLRIRSECGKIRTRKKIRSWTFFMQCAALIIRLFGLIVALPQSTKLLLLLKYSVTGNRTWWYLLSYCSPSSSFSALFCCNKFMSVSFIGTFALCWKIFLGSFLKSSLRFIA